MEANTEPVIIDIGTGTLKAGEASEDAPRYNIPMIMGKPKSKGALIGMDQKEWYIGDEAKSKKQHLIMSEPVIAGRIQDMDQFQKILEHLMNDVMQSSLEDHKVMISEVPLANPKTREELVERLFSEFKVPKLYLGNSAVLALFATGRTTGTVVDSGYGITHTVPIYEGFALPFATKEVPICGKDITNFLHDMLMKKHTTVWEDNSDFKYEAEKIKIKFGKVCQDFDAEIKSANDNKDEKDRKYKLPNGQIIQIREERLKCSEVLFAPSISSNSKAEDGIHKYTYDAIMKCDSDIRKNLFSNIVLAGGGTMFEGCEERMLKEISALAASPMKPEVTAPADRKHSQWLGGAILSQISPAFDKMWITRRDFEEEGKGSIVHKRCF